MVINHLQFLNGMILQVSSVFFCWGNSGRGSIIRPNVALGHLVVAFCGKVKPFQIDSFFFAVNRTRIKHFLMMLTTYNQLRDASNFELAISRAEQHSGNGVAMLHTKPWDANFLGATGSHTGSHTGNWVRKCIQNDEEKTSWSGSAKCWMFLLNGNHWGQGVSVSQPLCWTIQLGISQGPELKIEDIPSCA